LAHSNSIPEEVYTSEQSYKENYSDNQPSSHDSEMKRKLFATLKKSGVLDGMKSTMRSKLYEQLRLNSGGALVKGGDKKNQLGFKIATSIIADLMQKCDMPYALSVFLPESGSQSEILNKHELIEVLGLAGDDYFGNNV